MIRVIDRMAKAKEAACLTVSDMAIWFGVSRAAMCSWIGRTEHHAPRPETAIQLVPLLQLLEKVVWDKRMAGKLPVPLEIRQYDRKAYIQKVREDAINRFSKNRAARKGSKVFGKDK